MKRLIAMLAVAVMFAVVCGEAPAAGGGGLCSTATDGRITCEGEDFSYDPAGASAFESLHPGTSNDAYLRFESAGTVARMVVDTPTLSGATLVARGGYCDDPTYPRATVRVDGQTLYSADVPSFAWSIIRFPAPLEPGTHTIDISYDGGGCYLRVDYLRLLPFQPFPHSLWTTPAADKGTLVANPCASCFGGTANMTGLDHRWNKPIYFAKPGDPTTTNVRLTTDWSPTRDIAWDGGPIPIPAGCSPATQSDGHLVIVSADRKKSWEFWAATHCGTDGIDAAVISQWDLTGPGYAPSGNANSARGSGTPVIPSTVRADEALDGIHHAIGCTIPNVESSYIFPPASHSDGSASNGMHYGQLFVLDPSYTIPSSVSIGVRHVLEALKTYGCYLVDQGSVFEIDTDDTHPDIWSEAGISGTQSLPITGANMRLLSPSP